MIAPRHHARHGALLEEREPSVTLRDAGETALVRGVDFSLNRGETLSIVGESGSGKSVTAQALTRLLDPLATRVAAKTLSLNGRALLPLSERQMRAVRGGEIAMIFQDSMTALNPLRGVGAQIVEGIRRHSKSPQAEARARAEDMLARVQIPDPLRVKRHYPFGLSGGIRQRVMIAAALAMGTDVLLADAPTTALDATVQAQVLGLLTEFRDRLGLGIVLITQDFGVVAEVADRVAVMYAGRLVETARVQAPFDAPRHPYTIVLMGALPSRAATAAGRLQEIPGVVPTPGDIGPGCAFASRCALAREMCRQTAPAFRTIAPEHEVACHVVA